MRSTWTRLASTHGCMLVVLSPEMLTIKPHWFARWMIKVLGLDLYHEIPINNINRTRELNRWFSRGKVEVCFVTPEGDKRSVLLYLKNPGEFVDAVKHAMKHSLEPREH
jgi:hypothetical protein